MSIRNNLEEIHRHLPVGVQLVCVSKFHPAEMIEEAYEAGERIFGESRVQELCAKQEALQHLAIEWHFIGHLQTNKVKYIVPFISLIHGVDSPKLLAEINKEAVKAGRKVDCLLQVHIAQEETKFGFSPQELLDYLADGLWKNMAGIRITGLMGMASNVDNEEQVEAEFATLKRLFAKVKQQHFGCEDSFTQLSMGMSHDYPLALKQGSTLVRIGTAIFGERNY